MSSFLGAIALILGTAQAPPARPVIFEATSADRATGFRTLAECEAALGPAVAIRVRATTGRRLVRGTAFNRRAGNVSRCEIVGGEPLIVVYPTGLASRSPR